MHRSVAKNHRILFGAARRKFLRAAFISPLLLALASSAADVRKPGDSFIQPPKQVSDLISKDKNYATLNLPGPDGDHFVIPQTTELSDFKRMSKKTYRLAMLEVHPAVNREQDHSTLGIYGLCRHPEGG